MHLLEINISVASHFDLWHDVLPRGEGHLNDTLNQLFNRLYTPLSMAESWQEIATGNSLNN